MQSVELVLYIYIYIDIYIFLNVLFSVKWQVMFYYTYSNEEEVYIHSQGPFRTKKNNTALRRLKQTGGGWRCCRSHVAAFGRWMEQHKTGAAELLLLFLVCFFTENSQIVKKNKNTS